jgi:hypothetical protein
MRARIGAWWQMTMCQNVDRIRLWWAQPDRYRWFSGYLGHRNLQGFTARMMAAIVTALGVVPLLLMFTPAGPNGLAGRVVAIVVAGLCVHGGLWIFRFPTRRQSPRFVVMANLCIAALCLVLSSPTPA